ncbi:U11/U12 small nuclear ribonucleoprotein 65 kDa protein [Cicer arietinum]|uniref:U11/U12 small nuclear ribonucleoprotein 65 kDa protein n=2 Tax=IRL clade TaxID=2233839 RepID=A0A1S2XQX7_CICAR|nr:U11/U12 small nuclear ribonucleoprotein 65 kDa protein [Cicer arietinum]
MASNPSLQFGFQGNIDPNPCAGESSATLLIKHLPDAIPHDTLSRLLSHYGASSVRPCSRGRLRNCAFVDFKNDMLASQAHRQLNGLKFLGKVLSAERASKPIENGDKSRGAQLGKDSKTSAVKNENVTKPIDGDTKSGGLPIPEPIAHRLGVDYPFPPHLEYAYPPPDGNILTNIVNALIAVPRFYTQVLHLMNKMNIPAPFRMALPTPPLPPEVPAPPPPVPPPHSVTVKPQSADMSSDESEMESSDEEDGARTESSGRKRARREAIVGPAIDKDVAHESVGVKPATLIPKEIPMIKKNHVLKINIAPKASLKEHKDNDTKQELQEPDKEALDPNKFLTTDELERGKLPPEEILSLPMFKNYTAGNPASVLYIKNLAKDVIADDFYFLFGSFFGSTEAAKSGLQVKLMQEGRMRGQAFVTFPSTELAHRALNLVNGYVFKGKPMIIQFGRNPAAAKGT